MTKKAENIIQTILTLVLDIHDNPKYDAILTSDMRKVIWRLLLQREQFTPDEYSKVWLLASGAANTLNDNDKYYYLLRDQNTDYPNPCFC